MVTLTGAGSHFWELETSLGVHNGLFQDRNNSSVRACMLTILCSTPCVLRLFLYFSVVRVTVTHNLSFTYYVLTS